MSTIERKSFYGSINFNTELYDATYVKINDRGIERGGYGYDIGPNPYEMTTTTTIAVAVITVASNIFSLRSI